jgi:hypothetical protein
VLYNFLPGRSYFNTVKIFSPVAADKIVFGAFIWTVQALRKGETASRGRTAESNFTVDIPELQRHELPQTGNLYGN